MSKLFQNDVSEDPIVIMKESIEVKIEEVDRDGEKNLEPIVSFAVNRGKGTGSQKIPVAEFPEYLETLQHFRDNGFEEARVEGYRPAGEVTRETMGLVRPTESYIDPDSGDRKTRPIKDAEPNIVSWRTRTGKGSKPARVLRNRFSDVIEILEMVPQLLTEDRIQAAWVKHQKAAEARAEAERRKAEKAGESDDYGDGEDDE